MSIASTYFLVDTWTLCPRWYPDAVADDVTATNSRRAWSRNAVSRGSRSPALPWPNNLLRADCAAVIACEVRPEEACVDPERGLDRRGWRQRINRSRVIKSLRHFLPRILLGIALDSVIERLLERLRAPGAIERTRPDRHAARRSGVRIADFYWAYKAA